MSDLLDSFPTLKSIPASRERLVAQIMLMAFMSTREEGTDFVFSTRVFREQLRDAGFHVDEADHQILITEVQ